MTEDNRWNFLTVGGLGITLASLYFIRRSRIKSWIDVGRISHLSSKSLKGQTVLITGANTGLGFEAAKEFSKRGASNIVLACRDLSRGSEAVKSIKSLTGNSNVECLKLNLASLSSVRDFADEFRQKYDSLDVLICNAGVWIPMERSEKTEDGFEIHFGVNHLGHFLLIHLLLDKLRQSEVGARVIIVSSMLMNGGKIDIQSQDFVYQGRKEDGSSQNRARAPAGYSDSKLMNALVAKSLAKKFPELGFYAVCPGWCKTELGRYVGLNWIKKIMMLPVAFLFMRSAEQGCHNILYVAIEDKQNLENGGFYRDGQLTAKENSKLNSMSDIESKLYDLSEKLSGLK